MNPESSKPEEYDVSDQKRKKKEDEDIYRTEQMEIQGAKNKISKHTTQLYRDDESEQIEGIQAPALNIITSTIKDAQFSYTNLMQQIISSQESNLANTTLDNFDQARHSYTSLLSAPNFDQEMHSYTSLFSTPSCFENSMILTSNRIIEDNSMKDKINAGENEEMQQQGKMEGRLSDMHNQANAIMKFQNSEMKFNEKNGSALTEGETSKNKNSSDAEYRGVDDWSLDVFNLEENSNAEDQADERDSEQIDSRRNIINEQDENLEDSNATDENQEITEEDIEEFLEIEENATTQENNLQIDSKYTPQMGMQFKTSEESHHYFNFYAYIAGFSVAKTHNYRTTSKKRKNEITRVTYRCNRQGIGQEEQLEEESEIIEAERQTKVLNRTGCQCVMVVSEKNGIWIITRLDLDHNHELCPNSEARFMRSHKYMSSAEKFLIRTLKECNIPTRSMIKILSFLRGGLTALPYTKKDVSNVGTAINRETTNKDMQLVLMYFRKKQSEDHEFYYDLDLDENNRVRNMFWTDGRSKKYYEQYGDCVSFDTTYLTNRYNLPFAPFVGITGHANTCIFGCAFLVDETTSTFEWVFTTFLKAMGGKEPVSIITNQDGAMRRAIATIFKHSNHRNCIFHVKKNAREKAAMSFRSKSGLYEEFEDIINNSLTIPEFEELWQAMIVKYRLQNVRYFEHMWAIRERYVPVYFKQQFYPFIQSTTRSESTNARIKRNVGPPYSITSFMKEYERLMDTIFSKEYEDNHKSRTKKLKKLWSKYYFEEQAAEMYNPNIFKKFQLLLKDTTRLQVLETNPGNTYEVYQDLNNKRKELRSRKYIVIIDLPKENYSCTCAMFQKDGLLCSHILRVLLQLNVGTIHDKYFIERWTKKEKKLERKAEMKSTVEDSTLRFNVLSRRFADLASQGSKTEGSYDYLMEEIVRLQSKLHSLTHQPQEQQISGTNQTIDEINAPESCNAAEDNLEAVIQDPDIIQKKGRPTERFKTIGEKLKCKKKQTLSMQTLCSNRSQFCKMPIQAR